MLNHLDDPAPPDFGDDARTAVRTRGRSLHRRRRILQAMTAVVVVAALAASGLYARALTRIDDVDRVTVAGTGSAAPMSERTVLVAGVDATLGGPTRTDTLLLARFDPDDGLSILTIPRDLAVEGPQGDVHRINTLADQFDYSGLVEVTEAELRVDVHNFVAVDFDGFTRLVDLVGGIDITTHATLRDKLTGLTLDPGHCQRLDAAQALALARSRRLEVHTGQGWQDAPGEPGDLGRIQRQPVLLAAGLQALGRTRPDPLTADRLAGWVADHTTIDDSLDNDALLQLMRTILDLDPAQLDFTVLPVEHHTLDDGAAVLHLAPNAPETIDSFQSGELASRLETEPVISPCST